MTDSSYTPPAVWTWEPGNGGEFASINRPISGATKEVELPVGDHALQLYSMGTPNGQKVTILLEELLEAGHTEADYDAWLIKIGDGDQFGSGFVELNPNSKIPTLLDRSNGQRVFESGSILTYLAEKFGAFLPTEAAARAEVFNWLFWQMGAGPYVGGGFGHFFAYAPEKIEYAIDRFTMETKRQLHVLDTNLDGRKFVAGNDYSIADMAIYPWYGALVEGRLYKGSDTFLNVSEYENVQRWAADLAARPAVQRGGVVNRTGEGQLPERHSAEDFKAIGF
ncbi:MAG: glutathione-dependent disulfide-bond oxidoreductase [Donghicola eburneus]|nr:glutathione-dependent disulfide-bond oxidoreductase [Donghicola eburneus]MCI5042844.1 glutathione-dependent disulfide-bond oxidoreductase [Donghicola eburneus]